MNSEGIMNDVDVERFGLSAYARALYPSRYEARKHFIE